MSIAQGPPRKDTMQHDFSWDRCIDGHGVCECGARENTYHGSRPCVFYFDRPEPGKWSKHIPAEIERLRAELAELRQDRARLYAVLEAARKLAWTALGDRDGMTTARLECRAAIEASARPMP